MSKKRTILSYDQCASCRALAIELVRHNDIPRIEANRVATKSHRGRAVFGGRPDMKLRWLQVFAFDAAHPSLRRATTCHVRTLVLAPGTTVHANGLWWPMKADREGSDRDREHNHRSSPSPSAIIGRSLWGREVLCDEKSSICGRIICSLTASFCVEERGAWREGGREGGGDGWMDGWMDGWREGTRERGNEGATERGNEGAGLETIAASVFQTPSRERRQRNDTTEAPSGECYYNQIKVATDG